MDDSERDHLRTLRQRHAQRLRVLEEQVAIQGINTPPEVRIEIQDIRDTIALIETQLQTGETHLSSAGARYTHARTLQRVSIPLLLFGVICALVISGVAYLAGDYRGRQVATNIAQSTITALRGNSATTVEPATEVPTRMVDGKAGLIQRIDFDYDTSPITRGWYVIDTDEMQVFFQHLSDQFVGSAIAITSTTDYGLDFEVSELAKRSGKAIEYVIKPDSVTILYALVRLQRNDGSTKLGWLQFTSGEGSPQPSGVFESGVDEWLVPIKPTVIGGGWSLYSVDLEDEVQHTFGTDGWEFIELSKFRIRGNAYIDHIMILEQRK